MTFPGQGLVPLQDHVGKTDQVLRSTMKHPFRPPQVSAHNEHSARRFTITSQGLTSNNALRKSLKCH